MGLADLTRQAVEAAIAEYDTVGRDAFLTSYGFRDAKTYWLVSDGKRYPSKAIAGVAHKYVDGERILNSTKFTGGENSVAKTLRRLGFEVEAPQRNPDWTRDEIILALDLYMSNPVSPPGKTSEAVGQLSILLNKMSKLVGSTGDERYRNENGVYLKMMNLRALDPAFTSQGKAGMKAGGALEKVVWDEYVGRRDALAKDAQMIRKAIKAGDDWPIADISSDKPYEGEEGGVIIRLHRYRERDTGLIATKKKAAKAAGEFACEVCNFDFEKNYGPLGFDFIEVHHINPVHLMEPGTKTKLTDLALLCSNCHRMAHRKRIPLSLDEIRAARNH